LDSIISWDFIGTDSDPDIIYLSTGIGVAINCNSAGNADEPFSLVLYDRDENKYEGLMVSFNTFKLLLKDLIECIDSQIYEVDTKDFNTIFDRENDIIQICNENHIEGDECMIYNFNDVYELIETFETVIDFDWDYYANTPPPGFEEDED
jgi:hypothetical protein